MSGTNGITWERVALAACVLLLSVGGLLVSLGIYVFKDVVNDITAVSEELREVSDTLHEHTRSIDQLNFRLSKNGIKFLDPIVSEVADGNPTSP